VKVLNSSDDPGGGFVVGNTCESRVSNVDCAFWNLFFSECAVRIIEAVGVSAFGGSESTITGNENGFRRRVLGTGECNASLDRSFPLGVSSVETSIQTVTGGMFGTGRALALGLPFLALGRLAASHDEAIESHFRGPVALLWCSILRRLLLFLLLLQRSCLLFLEQLHEVWTGTATHAASFGGI